MIEVSTANLPVKTQRRTWRTNIESALGQSPVLTAYREKLLINADDGSVISRDQNAGRVDRALGDILDETVALADGTKITGAQFAEALPLFLDQWETEDVSALPPIEEVAPDAKPVDAQPAKVFTGNF